MISILHMRSNLGPIQGQSVFWRQVLSRSVDDPQFLRGQLGLAFQMIAILAVTRNIEAQYTDTGRGCKGNVLKDVFNIRVNVHLSFNLSWNCVSVED